MLRAATSWEVRLRSIRLSKIFGVFFTIWCAVPILAFSAGYGFGRPAPSWVVELRQAWSPTLLLGLAVLLGLHLLRRAALRPGDEDGDSAGKQGEWLARWGRLRADGFWHYVLEIGLLRLGGITVSSTIVVQGWQLDQPVQWPVLERSLPFVLGGSLLFTTFDWWASEKRWAKLAPPEIPGRLTPFPKD